MSGHSEVAESASSSIGSVTLKTIAGGSSLGAANALPIPADTFTMQTPIIGGFSLGDICQLAGTAYILGLVIIAIIKKYKAVKKFNKKLQDAAIMGGNGSNGP